MPQDRPDALYDQIKEAISGADVKINEISVKRKINLGNYDSIEVGAVVVPSSQTMNFEAIREVILKVNMQILDAIEQAGVKK